MVSRSEEGRNNKRKDKKYQSIENRKENIAPHLPSTTYMGPTIWRQRQRVNVLFPIPEENDTFFNIPHKYQITSNRNEFLQTD